MSDEAYPDALPVGHRLHWYVLEHVLGQGGFGITYLARDTNLDRRVAIKEYLPTDYARRHADATVRARTESNAERYAWGLERFSLEARTLARFDHPSIVRVHSVFEANNTAYMVMRFEDGENLAHLLERCVTLPERQLVPCLLAILDGLQLVHDAGFIHRDIKPENIYVRADGTPVLLDFGSARQSLGRAKTMTILVAPGYAPLEQYYGDSATQGPWTDIYGLGATCYRAIAGRAPLDAIARAKGVLGSAREMLQPAVEVGRGRYDERLLAAIDRALRLSERDRPQSIAEWRGEIAGSVTPDPARPATATLALTETAAPISATAPPPAAAQAVSVVPQEHTESPARRTPLLWGGAVAAVMLVAVTARLVTEHKALPTPVPTVVSVPAAPRPTAEPASVPVEVPPVAGAQEVARLPEPAPSIGKPTRNAPIVKPRLATITLPSADKLPVQEAHMRPPQSLDKAGLPAPPGPGLLARVAAPTSPEPAPSAKPAPAALPESNSPGIPVASLAPALPSLATPALAAAASGSMPNAPRENPARRIRDEQLAAAEDAWRRGDQAAAAELLAPLATAGVSRAQAMLGQVHEARTGQQPNYFEAYVWYSIAARGGEPGASSRKERVASKLQPAEIRQAEHFVERWKPHADATGENP